MFVFLSNFLPNFNYLIKLIASFSIFLSLI